MVNDVVTGRLAECILARGITGRNIHDCLFRGLSMEVEHIGNTDGRGCLDTDRNWKQVAWQVVPHFRMSPSSRIWQGYAKWVLGALRPQNIVEPRVWCFQCVDCQLVVKCLLTNYWLDEVLGCAGFLHNLKLLEECTRDQGAGHPESVKRGWENHTHRW